MADEYIKRERIEEFFNGIYDCADLTFYPNDHCCTADDCAHCKWRETMNAIKKGIREIPAADVVPVVRCKDCKHKGWIQEPCHGKSIDYCRQLEHPVDKQFFCGLGERKGGDADEQKRNV